MTYDPNFSPDEGDLVAHPKSWAGSIATCNICKKFKVPWDEIGKALMSEHLKKCK